MKTILFDLDDTLIESMHVWEDAVIRLFKKMAVLTSNTRALSEKVLDRLGMLEYMENVYSADELKMSKREVDIYEYVLKDLNTTAESAIVFEDSMYAINTARSLNIECIGLVNPNNQKVFEKNHVKTIVDFTELC